MNWKDWLKLTVYIFIIMIPINLLAYLTGVSQGSITYVQPDLVEIKTNKPIEFQIAVTATQTPTFTELQQVQTDEDINKAIIECNEIIWERLPQLEQRILEQNEIIGRYEETINKISWEKGEIYGMYLNCKNE